MCGRLMVTSAVHKLAAWLQPNCRNYTLLLDRSHKSIREQATRVVEHSVDSAVYLSLLQ